MYVVNSHSKHTLNNSLATAVVPSRYLYSFVMKAGPEDAANYRPLSLAVVVCKVFERIFKRVILDFLNERNAMTSCLVGHSVDGRRLHCWSGALDFAKAFNSVNHR